MKKRSHLLSGLLLALMAMLCAVPVLAEEAGAEAAAVTNHFVNTAWALLPPLIAIVLALLTKEVYSSLFIGVVAGAMLITNGNVLDAANRVFSGGIVASLSDSYNLGILGFFSRTPDGASLPSEQLPVSHCRSTLIPQLSGIAAP